MKASTRLSRLSLGLLDGDLGTALAGVGQVLDAAVDDGTNPLQELDPGIWPMDGQDYAIRRL
jgi:hypothetical protein